MKHMLSSALLAGFAAGLLCALLQYFLVEPKILLAERYESRELVYFQGVPAVTSDTSMAGTEMPAADTADYDHAGHEPSLLQRHALTTLFAVLTYCGYGLVLLAGIQIVEALGFRIGLAQGLLWGLAGFLTFQMLPALGLAPELPGTPAADLNARQIWWGVTAICTAFGLAVTAYGTVLWQRVLGVALLIVPHVWGAPELAGFGGVVPPELAASFAARSLGVGLVTWVVLGGLAVTFWHAEPAT